MPFKSEAQRRRFHAMAARGEISQATVREWEHATKNKKDLPMHVKKSHEALAKLAVELASLKQAGLGPAGDLASRNLQQWLTSQRKTTPKGKPRSLDKFNGNMAARELDAEERAARLRRAEKTADYADNLAGLWNKVSPVKTSPVATAIAALGSGVAGGAGGMAAGAHLGDALTRGDGALRQLQGVIGGAGYGGVGGAALGALGGGVAAHHAQKAYAQAQRAATIRKIAPLVGGGVAAVTALALARKLLADRDND